MVILKMGVSCVDLNKRLVHDKSNCVSLCEGIPRKVVCRCTHAVYYEILKTIPFIPFFVFFFTLANSARKITSADPSDLLSSNMVARNCLLGQSEFTFQILVSDAAIITYSNYRAIITSKGSLNCFVKTPF